MRKTLSLTVLFLFLLILSRPSFTLVKKESPASSKSHEAYFSETTWDFGKIPANSFVSHSFWIKNVGTDTLKILKVRPG